MKSTGTCPKCTSKNLIADAKAIDLGDSNSLHDMSVATFRTPGAFIFKGMQSTTVSAWVCLDCGFVEYYADEPRKLILPSSGSSTFPK